MPKQEVLPHPKTLVVGPMKFEVSSDKEDYYEFARKHDEHEVFGYMDYRGGRILLDPDQTHECMQDTLLHETLHVVWAQAGGPQNFDSGLEERIVSTMTAGLLNALQNNPKLVEYLTGRTYGSKAAGGSKRSGAIEPDRHEQHEDRDSLR